MTGDGGLTAAVALPPTKEYILRFISAHKGYELTLRNETITGFTQTGDPIYGEGRLKAFFQSGGISPWEKEQALEKLAFHGTYEGEDVTQRLAWFDTEWAQKEYRWSDEERKFVEERMLSMPGSYGIDYIMVEQPAAQLPWGSYDKITSPKRIVQLMQETGTDPSIVLAYERENQNRQEVIDAVEAASTDAPAKEDEVVVTA